MIHHPDFRNENLPRTLTRAALLAALALPPAAATAERFRGPCMNERAWGSQDGIVHYGSCLRPERDAVLTITCTPHAEDGPSYRADVAIPVNARPGSGVSFAFVIDGDAILATGRAVLIESDWSVQIEDADIGPTIVDGLADGYGAVLQVPGTRIPLILQGSRDAIDTMKRDCR